MLTASRVGGRGRLLFGLHRLLVRAHRFAEHRADTHADRCWIARFVDGLEATYAAGLADAGAEHGLHAVEARRAASRKVTPCR